MRPELRIPGRELREGTAALLDLLLVVVGRTSFAMENEEQLEISFGGLILAAAASAGAEVLYPEDLNHRQRHGAVLVRNPFRGPESLASE